MRNSRSTAACHSNSTSHSQNHVARTSQHMLFPDYDAFSPSSPPTIPHTTPPAPVKESLPTRKGARAARRVDSEATVRSSGRYRKLNCVQRKRLKRVWGQTNDTSIEISSARMQKVLRRGNTTARHSTFALHTEWNPPSQKRRNMLCFYWVNE